MLSKLLGGALLTLNQSADLAGVQPWSALPLNRLDRRGVVF